MKKIENKRQLLATIFSSPMTSELRKTLLTEMLANGEVTENDLAEWLIGDIEANREKYLELFRSDDMLRFLWGRFHDQPTYLARALVRARPDIFYVYGFAFRLVFRLGADLGIVLVGPHRPGDGGKPDANPIRGLTKAVPKDIFELDVECRFREFLWFFSRDFAEGKRLLAEEIDRAPTAYDRTVLRAVEDFVEDLLAMELPGCVSELHGWPFPALHVRWWLHRARSETRLLNMADTGAYKTAFAAISMRQAGCKRYLVVCPAHVRENWLTEVSQYFTDPPRVQLIATRSDVENLDLNAECTIVGYPQLIHDDVVKALLAGGFDGFIQDESHYGKGVDGLGAPPATRARACLRLLQGFPKCRYVALSATPWENRPEELAAVAVALRPDLFPDPEVFITSGAAKNPRLLREFFSDKVVEIELREVRDMPPIEPKPWEDLFGIEAIEMNPRHERLYAAVHGMKDMSPSQKVRRLLMAAIHPPLLAGRVDLPPDIEATAGDWRTSTKLVWIRRFIDERIATQKIVVATGIYATGITRGSDEAEDPTSVADLFRQWFGEDRVLVLDGTVAVTSGRKGEPSPRGEIVRRWRTDPDARILLVSMPATEVGVNLSVGRLPGVEGLAVTALSFGWKPWKQFLGRFFRHGQGVPVTYRVPVLVGTIDDDLARLNRYKWNAQQLFRALAPLTDREWGYLTNRGQRALEDLLRDSVEHVNLIAAMLRGRGESGTVSALAEPYGATRLGEAFARHFLHVQEARASGNISRFMKTVIDAWRHLGLLSLDKIFDAGCGPLTLERRLEAPVWGIDLNPAMIEVGRSVSPHHGANAAVGFLSTLPGDWTGRFELTVSSLVLDMSSMTGVSHGEIERLRILRELIRVTHPQGIVWLTWNEAAHTEKTLASWGEALRAEGLAIREELTGLVRATDHPEHPFVFWSLVFSPNGGVPRFKDVSPYLHAFELSRRKVKRGSNGERSEPPRMKRVEHHRFEIVSGRQTLGDAKAARDAAAGELRRWVGTADPGRTLYRSPDEIADLFHSDWRMIERLRERGIIAI